MFAAALLAVSSMLATASAGAANALAGHPSPYLAMHAEDPVDWQTLDRAALERAREQDKLLFVSSGYFACHWCHVMQAESFTDPGIARRLNRDFIPVKIDRELDPALDARLLDFVERTRGQAGWPLNVFITPEGYPLLGMVYLPRDAFAELLGRMAARWETDRGQLAGLARRAAEEAEPDPGAQVEGLTDADYRTLLRQAAQAEADVLQGGFGQQSKFPMAPRMEALLTVWAQGRDPDLEELLRTTLDAMAAGGLRDHLAGGFFRYTVDPGWQVPHFEKMLADNAQLAHLYLRAGALFDEPAYRDVGLETLDFILERMAAGQGGYVSALSAVGGDGEEGGAYLWTDAQLREALPDPGDRELARAAWHWVEDEALVGALPIEPVPAERLAGERDLAPEALARRIEAVRERLLASRDQRELPRDEKVLAGANGLVLRALARAADAGERYREAGKSLAARFAGRFMDDGRLMRFPAEGRPAQLRDHAFVASGLRAWSAVESGDTARMLLRGVLEAAWNRFYRDGRWHATGEPLLPILDGRALVPDGPEPSPAALLIDAGRGAALPPSAQPETALQRGHPALVEDPFGHASHVAAILRAGSD